MNYNEFILDIKKDNLKPVYFFTGDEEYLMYDTIEIFKDKYIDKALEALNFVIIEIGRAHV